MIKFFKRLLCLLIVSAVFFSVISCAAEDNTQNSEETTAPLTEITQETADPELQPDLPESDFEEYAFTFLCRFINGEHWAPWNPRDIYVEEQNGEVINDSVYKRNRFVEEKYNISIDWYSTPDYVNVFNKTITAGDDAYDVYYAGTGELINAAYSGRLNDLKKMTYIDLDQPW